MQKAIKYFTEKPKTLFLIDSLGALTTALLLVALVQPFNEYFGLPKTQLTYLSVIAVFFCLYSAACFFLLKENLTPFIRFIAIANLSYCGLTIGLLINYYSSLTFIGITYFLIEVVIVCGLSFIELNVAKEVNKNSPT